MSDAAASALVALFLGGIAVGGLLGGALGDAAAKRWPSHGRLAVTQFSVATGIPFSLLLLKVGGLATWTGCLLVSWAAPLQADSSSIQMCAAPPIQHCGPISQRGSLLPLPPPRQGLPKDGAPSSVALYAAVLLVFALLKAWPASSFNNPAFAEIVPPRQRSLIYAFDRRGGTAGFGLFVGRAGLVYRSWCLLVQGIQMQPACC